MMKLHNSNSQASLLAGYTLAFVSALTGCSNYNLEEVSLSLSNSSYRELDSSHSPTEINSEREILLTPGSFQEVEVSAGPHTIVAPIGTFASLSGTLENAREAEKRTDDLIVFLVPGSPSRYAIEIFRQQYCDSAQNPHDGTYINLIDRENANQIVSSLKIPSAIEFTSTRNPFVRIFSESSKSFYSPRAELKRTNTENHEIPLRIKHLEIPLTTEYSKVPGPKFEIP